MLQTYFNVPASFCPSLARIIQNNLKDSDYVKSESFLLLESYLWTFVQYTFSSNML